MVFFIPSNIFLESYKTPCFWKKILDTVGDGMNFLTRLQGILLNMGAI
jgi:hypothetical protein